MTDLGIAILCGAFFLLMLALCCMAHLMDDNERLRQRLKELEK